MDFALSDEQELIVATVREFTERELMPHEEVVERLGHVPDPLAADIRSKAVEAGIFSANMPVEVGGAGLDNVTMTLVEKELGKTSYGLHHLVARPSNILLACVGEQRDRYLYPTVAGERMEALAMSEPDAGSDLRGMKCRAVRDGDEYVIRGVKHFISHGDICDYVILFAATGPDAEGAPAGGRAPQKITAFLVDVGTPGFEVQDGYRCVSHRGYNNAIFSFDDCRVPAAQILGEEHRGFEVANTWLAGTRLAVAANCLGRAERGHEAGRGVGGPPHPVREDHRDASRSLVQAGGHGHQDGVRGTAHTAGCLEGRPRPDELGGRGDGQAGRHRDARLRDRRGHPGLRRDGPDGGTSPGATVARRPGGTHLGRDLGDTAAHHLPVHPPPAGRLRTWPDWDGC